MTLTYSDPLISIDSYQHLRRVLLKSLHLFNCNHQEEREKIQYQLLSLLDQKTMINENCPLLSTMFSLIQHVLGFIVDSVPISTQFYLDQLFSWGEILYPKETCELISLLIICQKFEKNSSNEVKIKNLSVTLLNTLDNEGEPIFSLFSQLDRTDSNEYRAAYLLFFSAMSSISNNESKMFYEALALKQKKALENVSKESFFISYIEMIIKTFFPLSKREDLELDLFSNLPLKFVDKSLNIVSIRTSKMTQMFVGHGCKSGMGYFKFNDVGIVNYGPQLHSIGDSSHFGIKGKGATNKFFRPFIEAKDKSISLDSLHLISSKGRESSFSDLEEDGFSGLWINAKQRGDEKSWSVSCTCEGLFSSTLYFVFYVKSESCVINRSQKLRPKSLDRYTGPSLEIECRGNSGSFILQALQGSKVMEVIPLAGDNSFWGADFLVAYRFNLPQQAPFISQTNQWKIHLI